MCAKLLFNEPDTEGKLRRIIGTALMLTLLAGGPAHAQQMIGFPLEDFGKIVLSSRQAASGARLEMDIGAYNNEPISNYGKQSLFARLGRPVGRLDVATDVRGIACTGFLISEKYVLTNHHCVPGLIAHLKSEAPQLGATRIIAVRLGSLHESALSVRHLGRNMNVRAKVWSA